MDDSDDDDEGDTEEAKASATAKVKKAAKKYVPDQVDRAMQEWEKATGKIGAGDPGAFDKVAEQFVDNFNRWRLGEPLANPVDTARGYGRR